MREVPTLGPRTVRSPLGLAHERCGDEPCYVADDVRVLEDVELAAGALPVLTRTFEKAGPRESLFFDPASTRVGIVTAGGLCPGTNVVIRSLVFQLFHKYGVRKIVGFRYGLGGLLRDPMDLGPDEVRRVHKLGGTILGTSRGRVEAPALVDALVARKIDVLIAIGGDGTMRAAHAMAREAQRRGTKLGIVGVPKTIDDDIAFVDKTYGFETAVAMARIAIEVAQTEAVAVENGIGLVKLMGREAGFIAANATIASRDVNACLVPEVPFEMDRLFSWLEARLARRRYAVVVVAEGCGLRLADAAHARRDESGNLRFQSEALDIGPYMKHAFERWFTERRIPVTLKYVDPSYMIRGVPADAMDAAYCDELARNAAHAAMAGKTDLLVGRWHRVFTHVPLGLVLSEKKRIAPDGELWLAVLEATGQPSFAKEIP
jgi:6-phosphofructokinase 1